MKKKIVISLCICIGCACFVVGVLLAILVFTRPVENIEIQRTIIEQQSSNRDFCVQVCIAVGTCLAVFIAIGGNFLKKMNEPKFKAFIEKDRPFYQLIETNEGVKHLYSIKIENQKRTPAEKVNVQLLKVKNLDTNEYISTIFPRLFVWTDNEISETTDIPMGIEKYFNFITVELNKTSLDSDNGLNEYSSLISFCTDGKINNTTFSPNILKFGNFRVYFRIAGSNFDPQTFSIDIKNQFKEQNVVPRFMEKTMKSLIPNMISPITIESINKKFKHLNFENDFNLGKIYKSKKV